MATTATSSVAVATLKFPPFITASKWGTVAASAWDAVTKRRSLYTATHPVAAKKVPRLTNGEVVTLVMAWLAAIGVSKTRQRELFPLWDQYAAAAYGWDPKSGKFVATTKQRDGWYPDVLLVELWRAFLQLAEALDKEGVPNPRLDLDGRFDDIVFQGEVRAALNSDGAVIIDTPSAHAAFKIPLPACKTKDGKTAAPKCKRVMKAWPYLCEEWDECVPVVVDDPVTIVKGKAMSGLQLVLLIGAFWLLFDNNKSRPRRR